MFAAAASPTSEFVPFDPERLFLGSEPWLFTLEIVFRTVVIYGYALFLVRWLGKRGVGQLSPFDHIIIVALGSSVGDPMFYPGVPLLHAMVVISVVIGLQRGLIWAVDRNERLRSFLESQPARLVDGGAMDLAGLVRENFARADLFVALREAGVEHLGQVKWAYLEPSGRVSVGKYRPADERPGLPVLPPNDDADHPTGTPAGDPPPAPGRYACWRCGGTADAPPVGPLPACPRCGGGPWQPAAGG